MTRNEIVDYEQRRWRRKLNDAREILGHAAKMYEKEPTELRRIDLVAARRMVQVTRAMTKEWGNE